MVVPQVAVPVKRHDACPMRHDGDVSFLGIKTLSAVANST